MNKNNTREIINNKEILSAMREVKSALQQGNKKNTQYKRQKQNEEDLLVLKDLVEDDVLLLDEIYEEKRTNITEISDRDVSQLKNTISKLIKSDIELWVKNNADIILEKHVKKLLSMYVKNYKR